MIYVLARPRRFRYVVMAAALWFLCNVLFNSIACRAAPAPVAPVAVERVLVVGDSQAQGLAGGLLRLFRRDHTRRILDRSKISTGLVGRANYDWPKEVVGIAQSEHADVAVVMFGANDRPNLPVDVPSNAAYDAVFRKAYAAHARAIVDALNAVNTPIIWVGHPITRYPSYSADMMFLNDIFAHVTKEGGATFLPIWDVFQDHGGGYVAYGPGIDGSTTRLRADDGVHLTAAGYDVVAKLLLPLLDQHRPAPPAPARMATLALTTAPAGITVVPSETGPTSGSGLAPHTPPDLPAPGLGKLPH